ncbi:MAG: hypothetical protein KF709_02120 [Gemmatimonadaceae bacterium]|nr:hypothetical protein [Gemmatimonadaceae bacterium]
MTPRGHVARRWALRLTVPVAMVLAWWMLMPLRDDERSGFDTYFLMTFGEDASSARDLWVARSDSLRALQGALRRTEAAQRVAQLLAVRDGRRVSADAWLPRETRTAFVAAVTRVLDSMPEDAAARVRVHIGKTSDSDQVGLGLVYSLPTTAGAPCIVLLGIGPQFSERVQPSSISNLLGPCAFYARFGAPGSGMHAWLMRTYGAAAGTIDPPVDRPGTLRRRARLRDVRSAALVSCTAGRLDACERYYFLVDARTSPSRFARLEGDALAHVVLSDLGSWRRYPAANLARIRLAIGDAAFERVWRSEHEPVEALRVAEGRSAGALAHEILMTMYEPRRPGPLPAGLPLLASAVMVVGASLAGMRLSARRQS